MAVPSRFRSAPLAAFACAVTLLASACSVLPPRETIHTWQPPQSTTVSAPAAAPAPDFSLRVDTPDTNGMLDGTGIVVMPESGQISTYKGARWSDSPALLVRDRLVDAFMSAGLSFVTTADDRLSSDYVLSGALRAFQSEYHQGAPVVTVRFDTRLRRSHSRTPLASHSFVITQNPAGVEVPQIVDAFGAADDELAKQVVAWTLEQVQRDAHAHAPTADGDSQSH